MGGVWHGDKSKFFFVAKYFEMRFTQNMSILKQHVDDKICRIKELGKCLTCFYCCFFCVCGFFFT